MLTITGLNAWYGASHILQGIDLEVNRGEIVCLVGRNGAGKTTTLRSVMGLAGRSTGRVTFEGTELLGRPAHIRNGLGLGMSGGEQQMLAIARATVSRPKLIMLDEPSEGIMPVLVDEMMALFTAMRAQGTTLLLVEQNVELALGIADRAYIMDGGAIVYEAAASALLADEALKERYCSV